MKKRKLGKTDLMVSEIALGTWGLAARAYGPATGSEIEAVIAAAYEAGVTTFDVSPAWGKGEAERRLALALGDKMKDAFVIGRTGQVDLDGRLLLQFDTYVVVREVEESLKRLSRDHIDLLLLHNPPVKVLGSHLFEKGLAQLKSEGKIRAWGVAVGTVGEATLAIQRGAEAICITHNLSTPDDLLDLAEPIQKSGCGVIARSPLAYGLLAGKWNETTTFPETDHRSRRWSPASFSTRLSQVEDVRFLVKDGIPDLSTAALRYALATPLVSCALVGARTPEQIRHAVAALPDEGPYFSGDDLERLATMEL